MTKAQLDEVYQEVERLQHQWSRDKKDKFTQRTNYTVSHKLLGYFLQAYEGSNLPQVVPKKSPLKKLDDIEKPQRDPKTGRYLPRKR